MADRDENDNPQGEIDKAHLAEALAQLKHAARDWQNLNGEERHGTIHNAIHELEEAINVE